MFPIKVVVVEGESILLNNFFQDDLWNEAFVYTGTQFFGKSILAPKISGKTVAIEMLGDCMLHILRKVSEQD